MKLINNIDVNTEYCDPFDEKYNYIMRIEHLGRYLWAKDVIKKHNCNNVLDVACANGYGTKILSEVCKNITGIDNKNNYLKYAIENYYAQNINYIFKNIDTEKIDGIFDCIVCFETLEHLKHPEAFIKQLNNNLNQDGILLISIPNDKYELIESPEPSLKNI